MQNSFNGWLLAGIVSACMYEKSDSASDIQQAVHTLVLEADSLMQSDSLFWNQPIDKSHPQVCIHDSLIRQKLDSALALRPNKQTYLLKYRYLLQSWRLLEVLDLLREMDGCMSDSMSSELLHLKAVLEDYKGDTLTARRDFLRADSAYTIKNSAGSTGFSDVWFCPNRKSAEPVTDAK